MNESKLKHLEFIQAVIGRMSSNSFLIKGWSITLVAALFALAAENANVRYAVIAYIPIIIFWILDGFFIAQEKQYRELYKIVSLKSESEIDFNMDASAWRGEHSWPSSIFTKTLIPFHGTAIVVVSIVMFVIS